MIVKIWARYTEKLLFEKLETLKRMYGLINEGQSTLSTLLSYIDHSIIDTKTQFV